jgi:hypothetical protein
MIGQNTLLMANSMRKQELDFLQKASSLTLSYGNQTYESENTASGKFTPLAIAGNFTSL